MLTTRVIPTSGEAWVGGIDVVAHPAAAKQVIGVVPQTNTLDRSLDVAENLFFHGRYFGMNAREAHQRTEQLLEQFRLADRAHAGADELSGGMAQRLMVARAIMHEPDVLFLDEPTTGLDPAGMRDMRALVRRLAGEGITVLLSSHILAEVEELCNRVAIIRKGRIVYEGGLAELLATASSGFRLRTTEQARAEELCQAQPGIEVQAVDGELRLSGDEQAVAALTIALGRAGIGVTALVPQVASLEELFLGMTEGAEAVA
jgi:ABC-2 type transport system ATP-binding protein